MQEQAAAIIYNWATYLGLFVATCLTISSMLFLLYYIVRAMFFWRYKTVSQKMKNILDQVVENNRGLNGNAELCFLAGALLLVLDSKYFTRETLEELKNELQLEGITDIDYGNE